MNGFFHPDNAIFQFLSKVFWIVQISLLWFLFSLPVITAGAATSAMYYAANKTVFHQRGYAWQEFLTGFKNSFRPATVGWLIALLLYGLAFLDFYILRIFARVSRYANLDYVILIVCLSFVTVWIGFLFPCIARFENKTGLLLKNALVMAILHLPTAFLMLILLIAAGLLLYRYPQLFFVVPGGYICCAVVFLERVFRRYMSAEDLAAEEKRNRVEKN